MTETVQYKLLVIDDETSIREGLIAYLDDEGFLVFGAADGQQGINLYYQEKPDVVLCDLRMPGIDGLAVLQEITSDNPNVPIIVISGVGVMSDVVDALRLGASDYFIKPISDMEVLHLAIQRCIDKLKLLDENKNYRIQLEATNQELRKSLEVLRQDQQAGRLVQMKMLPETPYKSAGCTFEHLIIPSLYLSGDCVDYLSISSSEVLFYLADVSGHGASSAFITVILKRLINQLSRDYVNGINSVISSSNKLMSHLNLELVEAELGKHVTLFIGIVDTENNILRYSASGHYPMPIFHGTDCTKFLTGKALPIGLFESAQYEEYTLELPDEFSLVMFSDGVLEVLPHNNLEDKERFLLSLVQKGACSIENIQNELKLKNNGEAPDDIALMTVARAR